MSRLPVYEKNCWTTKYTHKTRQQYFAVDFYTTIKYTQTIQLYMIFCFQRRSRIRVNVRRPGRRKAGRCVTDNGGHCSLPFPSLWHSQRPAACSADTLHALTHAARARHPHKHTKWYLHSNCIVSIFAKCYMYMYLVVWQNVYWYKFIIVNIIIILALLVKDCQKYVSYG